uniref:Uncharacterized protein n=1 Tax=Oryza punctata TaxID=4537 RepID=A0A0E0K9D9_ORYPU
MEEKHDTEYPPSQGNHPSASHLPMSGSRRPPQGYETQNPTGLNPRRAHLPKYDSSSSSSSMSSYNPQFDPRYQSGHYSSFGGLSFPQNADVPAQIGGHGEGSFRQQHQQQYFVKLILLSLSSSSSSNSGCLIPMWVTCPPRTTRHRLTKRTRRQDFLSVNKDEIFDQFKVNAGSVIGNINPEVTVDVPTGIGVSVIGGYFEEASVAHERGLSWVGDFDRHDMFLTEKEPTQCTIMKVPSHLATAENIDLDHISLMNCLLSWFERMDGQRPPFFDELFQRIRFPVTAKHPVGRDKCLYVLRNHPMFAHSAKRRGFLEDFYKFYKTLSPEEREKFLQQTNHDLFEFIFHLLVDDDDFLLNIFWKNKDRSLEQKRSALQEGMEGKQRLPFTSEDLYVAIYLRHLIVQGPEYSKGYGTQNPTGLNPRRAHLPKYGSTSSSSSSSSHNPQFDPHYQSRHYSSFGGLSFPQNADVPAQIGGHGEGSFCQQHQQQYFVKLILLSLSSSSSSNSGCVIPMWVTCPPRTTRHRLTKCTRGQVASFHPNRDFFSVNKDEIFDRFKSNVGSVVGNINPEVTVDVPTGIGVSDFFSVNKDEIFDRFKSNVGSVVGNINPEVTVDVPTGIGVSVIGGYFEEASVAHERGLSCTGDFDRHDMFVTEKEPTQCTIMKAPSDLSTAENIDLDHISLMNCLLSWFERMDGQRPPFFDELFQRIRFPVTAKDPVGRDKYLYVLGNHPEDFYKFYKTLSPEGREKFLQQTNHDLFEFIFHLLVDDDDFLLNIFWKNKDRSLEQKRSALQEGMDGKQRLPFTGEDLYVDIYLRQLIVHGPKYSKEEGDCIDISLLELDLIGAQHFPWFLPQFMEQLLEMGYGTQNPTGLNPRRAHLPKYGSSSSSSSSSSYNPQFDPHYQSRHYSSFGGLCFPKNANVPAQIGGHGEGSFRQQHQQQYFCQFDPTIPQQFQQQQQWLSDPNVGHLPSTNYSAQTNQTRHGFSNKRSGNVSKSFLWVRELGKFRITLVPLQDFLSVNKDEIFDQFKFNAGSVVGNINPEVTVDVPTGIGVSVIGGYFEEASVSHERGLSWAGDFDRHDMFVTEKEPT